MYALPILCISTGFLVKTKYLRRSPLAAQLGNSLIRRGADRSAVLLECLCPPLHLPSVLVCRHCHEVRDSVFQPSGGQSS